MAGIYRLELSFPIDGVPDPFGVRVERVNQAPGRWLALDDSRNPLRGPGTAVLARNEGSEVFVAGLFTEGKAIARRVSDGWDIIGLVTRPDDVEVTVWDLAHDGTSLYAAGNFTSINGVATHGVARWDGSKWESLGAGIQVTADGFANRLLEVRALQFVGKELYATGIFRKSGNVDTFNLSRWDGAQWNVVPVGLFTNRDGIGGELNPQTFGSSGSTLAAIDNALYVGGQFLFPSRNIGAWRNGSFEHPMLGGVTVSSFISGSVGRIKSANGVLYVSGDFELAGVDFQRLPVRGFAIWDGTEWRDPGFTMPRSGVNDFEVAGGQCFIGGSLETLHGPAVGDFTPSTPVQGIGLWDGTQWRSLGRGVETEVLLGDDRVRLGRGDISRLDHEGGRVYVTGRFTRAGGMPASYFGIWEKAP